MRLLFLIVKYLNFVAVLSLFKLHIRDDGNKNITNLHMMTNV